MDLLAFDVRRLVQMGKVTMDEAAAILAKRREQDREYDSDAATEGRAIKRAPKRIRHHQY